MVDDELDSDYEYQLLNDAKNEVEAMQVWEQLKSEQSYSAPQGLSYTTALGTLPTRFALPLRMMEDTSYVDYDKVDFEDRYSKVNAPYGYFIDLANNNIYLAGQNHNAKTMYFYYTKYSADIAAGTSWAFPDRFHSILPLKMAEIYYAADAGEKARAWDDRWSAQFERELGRMTVWNDQLKLKGRQHPNRRMSFSPKANV
jgi:hypothetical protein